VASLSVYMAVSAREITSWVIRSWVVTPRSLAADRTTPTLAVMATMVSAAVNGALSAVIVAHRKLSTTRRAASH